MSETRPLRWLGATAPCGGGPARRRRGGRLLAGLAPLAIALGALPLLAPTCGDPGEGFKTFSRSSIIIPMDVCYQTQADGMQSSYAPASCPQAVDAGDIIKAYGLVYQLIRNGIAVYWVIDNAKATVTGVDLTIQYAGGFPVQFYDWTPEDPPPATPPTALHDINYRGGPFVVDGSDFDRANQVLQSFRASGSGPGSPGTFQNVNVHVSNVAFRAYAKRTMAGGWSAGGTVAPKVALLDIGSTSAASGGYAKNSEPIIRGYLARAGLDFAGAGGVATDAGHGQIYDRLGMADFQPTPGGDWTTTNLAKYGYQILWVPHWFAPGSCANATSQTACAGSLYGATQVENALRTIGAFSRAGKDVFAECAGLGSFEGVNGNPSYASGIDPDTHFQEETGLAINRVVGTAQLVPGNFSSPLMQLGDYPFLPRSGAIQNYKPVTAPYRPGVQQLVEDQADPTYDYFTILPAAPDQHGTVVYLAGHVYSGYSDTLGTGGALQPDLPSFEIGGTRLVLNTLFNLGATCTASGVSCNTGQLGVCAQGTLVCQGGQPVCAPVATPSPEVCNGLDDNCNGEVDEGLQQECYDGPSSSLDPVTGQPLGLCRVGMRSCVRNPDSSYSMSSCVGQVLPASEVCNGLDDDCDGETDEGLAQACYEGPSSSIEPVTGQPRGACRAGTQTCALGSWGACVGQVLPRPEFCGETGVAQDDDCDGVVNNGCTCTTGQERACYGGPAGTAGVGLCTAGVQNCTSGAWGACIGEQRPQAEICGNGVDEDCNGLAPPCPECTAGQTRSCYPGGAGDVRDRPDTQCKSGTQSCAADHWGPCVGAVLPSSFESCDAIDNDCDGLVDDSAVCPAAFVCEHGVCVPDACGVELPPPEGYVCNPPPPDGTGDSNGTVERGTCGTAAATCPDGVVCRYGECVPPCVPGQCATGSVCGGGACVAGGCYATGCPTGELCRGGACAPDPCQGPLAPICPSGTFCRAGDCVQACAFVSCAAGERCGIDGFCEPDPCAAATCSPGQRCAGGACAANPCADSSCASGQVCAVVDGAATCVDDPCAGIRCPVGACSDGQCYSAANPTGAGRAPPEAPAEESKGCGCGSGSEAALPALLALLAAPLARRRRRSTARPGLVLLLAATALLAAACKHEQQPPFDPTACSETCGEQRCVDVATDPSHCSACGAACGSGEICVDATCGPAAAVAPFIEALSPAEGPSGSPVPLTVRVTGQRFAPGATVRVVSGSTTRTVATTVTDAGHLSVDLDLSGAGATTWQLRVVNPGKVISNAAAFDVLVPFPNVTSVTPAVVNAGTSTEVVLAGTGFNATSQCRMRSPGVPEIGLPSTVDAAGVHCTVDARMLAPGAYEIWVVNDGTFASNIRELSIVSQAATLTAVSPSSGPANSTISLTLSGTGFDPSSRVLFDGCAAPADPPSCPIDAAIVGTTYVSPTTLHAALTLPPCASASCAHGVSVQNGAGTTLGLAFSVAADAASVTTFATSPAPPYQGDAAVTLSFGGTNLSGSTIEVQPPAGAFGDVPVTAAGSTATTATGTIDLVGRPEGSYLARIVYGVGGSSAAWPFRVLSNQAILRDYVASPSPERSGPQGTLKSTVTFEVANLRPPYADVRVIFRGPGGFSRVLDPSPDPTAATSPLTVSSLSLADLDTGTYAFTVLNGWVAPPGTARATESNALSFNVTPGVPTLSTVSPSSYPLSSPTPLVTVTLTGNNFAKPDASGNGGSIVHILAPALGIPDYAIPAADTTVVSRTQIRVQLDVRDGLPGAYDVEVWNPSLPTTTPPAPQRSNTLAGGFTIAP